MNTNFVSAFWLAIDKYPLNFPLKSTDFVLTALDNLLNNELLFACFKN